MFHVYILRDDSGKLYKGMTNSLERRLSEHRRGKTKTNRSMKNIKLVYSEEHSSFAEARKREKYLKSAVGRRFIKNNSALSSVG